MYGYLLNFMQIDGRLAIFLNDILGESLDYQRGNSGVSSW